MGLRSRNVLVTYVSLSIMIGVYQATLFHLGHALGHSLRVTWGIVSLLLLVFWVELDCREHNEIYRPFEFGFLLLIFWPFYLPYYLFRTRGAYAVLWLAGFCSLSFMGYALECLIYIAREHAQN